MQAGALAAVVAWRVCILLSLLPLTLQNVLEAKKQSRQNEYEEEEDATNEGEEGEVKAKATAGLGDEKSGQEVPLEVVHVNKEEEEEKGSNNVFTKTGWTETSLFALLLLAELVVRDDDAQEGDEVNEGIDQPREVDDWNEIVYGEERKHKHAHPNEFRDALDLEEERNHIDLDEEEEGQHRDEHPLHRDFKKLIQIPAGGQKLEGKLAKKIGKCVPHWYPEEKEDVAEEVNAQKAP